MHRSVILIPSQVAQRTQLFSPSDVPGSFSSGSAYNTGTAFFVTQACNLIAIRFYKSSGDTSNTHTVVLWDVASHANLGQKASSGEPASGWIEVTLTTPIALTANKAYYVTTWSPNGFFNFTNGYFGAAAVVKGAITAYKDGTVPGGSTANNGVYSATTSLVYPGSGFNANYWSDPVIDIGSAAPALRSYSTVFPAPSENPISESAMWINGLTTGLDWTDCRKTTGFAFGTMPGDGTGNQIYADSTALLTGTWASNQQAQATVKVVSADSGSNVFQEVELRLRSVLSAHVNSGYEVNLSISPVSNNFYLQVIKWNGPINSYSELDGTTAHGVDGDILKATAIGNVITAYLNNTQVLQVTDSTSPWASGAPGMGFFLQNKAGIIGNFGFSAFSATEL